MSEARESAPPLDPDARHRSLRGAAEVLARRYLPDESQRLFALTLVVGLSCGLVAVGFHLTIQGMSALLIDRALHARAPDWMFWTIATPTLGGLSAGAALTWIVPGARGSGVPQVKRAFAVDNGLVRFRDALGKFVVGSAQIGSGASLGREGPTVQVCAGTASLIARIAALPPDNRRRLTAVGVAAGIAAAFNAPIAAVTFTIEEIVGTLDQTILSGVVVAAALAAVVERSLLGVHPVIQVDAAYGLDHAASLASYALLGVVAAVVSVLFTESLLRLRLAFRRLRVLPPWAHPAVGGLVTGILAVVCVRALETEGITGGGYATLGSALAGSLSLRVLIALAVLKTVATVFSYSSGGAGGIFAPTLFVGAMVGGAIGHLDVALFTHEAGQRGAFALVGMGAVFAGVIRAPITSVLIIFEMTGGYGLVLPLMLANMTSYALARRWRPMPIYEALLVQDGVHLPRPEDRRSPLDHLTVASAMTRPVITTQGNTLVSEALRRVGPRVFHALPILSEGGRPMGLVPISRLVEASENGHGATPVRRLMVPATHIPPSASLAGALVRMNDEHVRQLLVVESMSGMLVGILTMADIVRVHAHHLSTAEAATLPPPPLRPTRSGTTDAATVGGLMRLLEPVSAGCPVVPLMEALLVTPGHALPVDLGREDVAGFVTLRSLRDLVREEHLRGLLVAADVAVAVPPTPESATPLEALRVLEAHGVDELPVIRTDTATIVGLVSRNTIERACRDRVDHVADDGAC